MSTGYEALVARLPVLLDHFGVAVGAVSGVLAARGKHVDLFGVLVLALVTSFGGGTLRDLLVGDLPVAWIYNAPLFSTAMVAALITFFSARFFEVPRQLLLLADAVALALFTVNGTRKALNFEVSPLIAVAMGVITGVAGGMIRDVLTGEIPLVLRPQTYLYATAAMLGASIFVLMQTRGWPSQAALLSGAGVTLLLRVAAIRWKVGLPVFTPRSLAKEHSLSSNPLPPR